MAGWAYGWTYGNGNVGGADPEPQPESKPSGWHVWNGDRYIGVVFADSKESALSKAKMMKGTEVVKVAYRSEESGS